MTFEQVEALQVATAKLTNTTYKTGKELIEMLIRKANEHLYCLSTRSRVKSGKKEDIPFLGDEEMRLVSHLLEIPFDDLEDYTFHVDTLFCAKIFQKINTL